MSLRPLSDSERAAARDKATAARAARAAVKNELKTGDATVAEVIASSAQNEAIGRLKVSDLLESLPGVGKVRASAIMEEVGIASTRRVRGLGVHQRAALIAHLGER